MRVRFPLPALSTRDLSLLPNYLHHLVMRNTPIRRSLPWVLAAMTAVALPGVYSASAAPSGSATTKMLSAQLPSGVSLAKASCAQTTKALSSAVSQRPDLATSLTEAAVLARTPKQGQGELSCDCLTKIVGGGVAAAPAQSNAIVQMALSLHPECADSLNALLATTNGNAPSGFDTPQDLYGGFGVGFGPGFPGSPGFTGSPPSGAISLPPATVATTSDTNG